MQLDLTKTAFDIDGVVVDVVTPFLRRLGERHGYVGFTHDDVTTFDIEKALGVPRTVVDELVDELLESPLEVEARPYPGAVETLTKLSLRGPLLFVTARPKAGPMTAWFRTNLPEVPEDRIKIVATGDFSKKLACLLDYGRQYFIDDHLETCRILDQAGLQSFVFDQPWNRGDVDLPRVHGWGELGRLFDLS